MPEHPIDPASLVDIARYPLDNPQDDRYRNTLSLIRAQLEQDGCAVIPGFLSSHGLSHLLDEAQERRELAYFSANKKTNVYFSSDDPSLAEDHPRRIFLERTNGFITSDCYDESTASHSLYHWPALMDFIQDRRAVSSIGTLTPTSSRSPCCSKVRPAVGILNMLRISEMQKMNATRTSRRCSRVTPGR